MTINWLKKRCPVCGRDFDYIEGGYAPKTCNSFDCVWEYILDPQRYQSFNEFVDRCRIRAKI